MKNENQAGNVININCADHSRNERFLSPSNGNVVQKANTIINMQGNSVEYNAGSVYSFGDTQDYCSVTSKKLGKVLLPQIIAWATELSMICKEILALIKSIRSGSFIMELRKMTEMVPGDVWGYLGVNLGWIIFLLILVLTFATLCTTIQIVIRKRKNVPLNKWSQNEYKKVIIYHEGIFYSIKPKECHCGGKMKFVRENGNDYIVCRLTGNHSKKIDITELL